MDTGIDPAMKALAPAMDICPIGDMEAGRSVRWMAWLPTASGFRAPLNDPDADELLSRRIDAGVPYADDLFSARRRPGELPKATEAAIRAAFEPLSHRCSARRPTLITGRRYLSWLMAIGEGSFSRVCQAAKGYALPISRGAGKNRRTMQARAAGLREELRPADAARIQRRRAGKAGQTDGWARNTRPVCFPNMILACQNAKLIA